MSSGQHNLWCDFSNPRYKIHARKNFINETNIAVPQRNKQSTRGNNGMDRDKNEIKNENKIRNRGGVGSDLNYTEACLREIGGRSAGI